MEGLFKFQLILENQKSIFSIIEFFIDVKNSKISHSIISGENL